MKIISILPIGTAGIANPSTMTDSEADALLERHPRQDIFVRSEPKRTPDLVISLDDPAE